MPRPRDLATLGLFVREHALDAAMLVRVRRALDADSGVPAEVQAASTRTFAVDETARRAWDVPLTDALLDAVLERIESSRPALEAWCGRSLEACDGVAAVRYPAGAFYRRHRDAASEPDEHGLHRRTVSVVIFVNSGGGSPAAEFTGGCLRLYELGEGAAADEGVDIEPEAGTLVAFPSTLLHEVTPVETGERYSLVAWLLANDVP